MVGGIKSFSESQYNSYIYYCKLRQRVAELKERVAEFRSCVAELKERVAELRSCVAELKERVAEFRSCVAELKERFAELRSCVNREVGLGSHSLSHSSPHP